MTVKPSRLIIIGRVIGAPRAIRMFPRQLGSTPEENQLTGDLLLLGRAYCPTRMGLPLVSSRQQVFHDARAHHSLLYHW